VTKLREILSEQVVAKLDRYHIVVWTDPQGEYGDSVGELIPEDTNFERFAGSWYELRRRIEPELARSDPRLVVYVDADEPDEDPLAELRVSGTEFRTRLGTVLRQAMGHELAATRLDEIASAATTLVEAEALLEDGAGGPAGLIKTLGPHEPTDLVLRLATEGDQILKDHPGLFDEVQMFVESQLGIRVGDTKNLPGDIARHLILVELVSALGELPDTLKRSYHPVSAEQRRRCETTLHRWKHDQRLRSFYNQRMRNASADLALSTQLNWHDVLTDLDSVPAYDDLAFAEYLRRVKNAAFIEAEELAHARLSSLWVAGDEMQEASQRWRVAYALALLRRLLASTSKVQAKAKTASVAELLTQYGESDWEIDRAHRRLELSLLGLVDRQSLEDVVREGRRAYDDWLDAYLRRFTAAAEVEGLVSGELQLQSHVHSAVVAPRAKHRPVCYFMVDALRFELAQDLLDALRRQFDQAVLELRPAVGVLPSITPVGMANLCPGAEEGIHLTLEQDRLVVRIDGHEVMTPTQRVALLQAAHGKVADLRLDDIVRLSQQELAEQVAEAALVLVRSQEIDEQGETGKLNIGLHGFDATVQQLSRSVARLAHHGLSQFVISADHGFVTLTRDVGGHMIIPKPGGRGEVHRRAVIGRGGTATDALLRLPLEKVGLPGDLDVLVPRGLALIAAGGARGFFHGGLSPQEIVVPVLSVEVEPPKGSSVLEVEAEIASRITSHIFTGKVAMPHNLLSEPLTVRPVPVRHSDGKEIGSLATAGGAEEGEGLVRLTPGEEVILGFRVTVTVNKGDKVELQVFDARTDRRLVASAKVATVARALEVEDDLP
jgi:hypothetical protein